MERCLLACFSIFFILSISSNYTFADTAIQLSASSDGQIERNTFIIGDIITDNDSEIINIDAVNNGSIDENKFDIKHVFTYETREIANNSLSKEPIKEMPQPFNNHGSLLSYVVRGLFLIVCPPLILYVMGHYNEEYRDKTSVLLAVIGIDIALLAEPILQIISSDVSFIQCFLESMLLILSAGIGVYWAFGRENGCFAIFCKTLIWQNRVEESKK